MTPTGPITRATPEHRRRALTPFDRFKARYLKAGGSIYQSDEWIMGMMPDRNPEAVAQMSRMILGYEFDEFIARVLSHHGVTTSEQPAQVRPIVRDVRRDEGRGEG